MLIRALCPDTIETEQSEAVTRKKKLNLYLPVSEKNQDTPLDIHV